MPLYFFDLEAKGLAGARDEMGTEFRDDDEAKRAARLFVPEFVSDTLKANHNDLRVDLRVRDESGCQIYCVRLVLNAFDAEHA